MSKSVTSCQFICWCYYFHTVLTALACVYIAVHLSNALIDCFIHWIYRHISCIIINVSGADLEVWKRALLFASMSDLCLFCQKSWFCLLSSKNA